MTVYSGASVDVTPRQCPGHGAKIHPHEVISYRSDPKGRRWGICPRCYETIRVRSNNTLHGHQEPYRMVIYRNAGLDQLGCREPARHPITLPSVPTRLFAVLAWLDEDTHEPRVTWRGGRGHSSVTHVLSGSNRYALFDHMTYTERHTHPGCVIELVPAITAWEMDADPADRVPVGYRRSHHR